ncbi:hypothetical protein [Corynebacterium ulceribovis]|uniref:hypothetical protein n=1 Tax=Corynebacterium ulceribovis TaxID=487732 RepID=UPI0003647858|nr:hypothetical protein [Corynebacterium ulceribovis]
MEPIELSAGRVHIRPIQCDERVDDTPALTEALGRPITEVYVDRRLQEWRDDMAYSWVVCESSNPVALGEIVLRVELMLHSTREGAALPMSQAAVLTVHPVGDPSRKVPTADGGEIAVWDALMAGAQTVRRWCDAVTGVSVGRVVMDFVAVAGPHPGQKSGQALRCLPFPVRDAD